MTSLLRFGMGALAAAALLQMAGCPAAEAPPEFIAGGTGDAGRFAAQASVRVFSPQNDLSIGGGTPVEVNFQAVATTNGATVTIIFDVDGVPNNGNELTLAEGLPFTTTTTQVNTANVAAGEYNVGVLVIERNEIVAFNYATGQVTVNQRPQFFFTSPRSNFDFDRGERITPRFDVAWTVSDPDSVVNVEIYLDPDGAPNGNEVLLRESNSQTGDAFSFDLPTASFAPGRYQLLAQVSDGVTTNSFYAPGSIRIRSRLSSYVDLRPLGQPSSPISGAIFEGFNPHDNAGSLVSTIRDIDNDGFADFMIVAQFGKPQYQVNFQRTGVGEAYLVYGRNKRFSGLLNLNSTGTLFRGEIFGGIPEVPIPVRPSRGITSISTLSDWDGDGVREMAMGVPFTDSDVVGGLGSLDQLTVLDATGYFRSGGVVVTAGSALRPDLGFPGRHVFNLAEFGTLQFEFTEPQCDEGFFGPKAPASPFGINDNNETTRAGITYFHFHYPGGERGGGLRGGCRISSNEFGDQFGETVSAGEFDAIVISAPNRDPFTATATNFAANTHIGGAGVVTIYFPNVIGGAYPWSYYGQGPGDVGDSSDAGLLPHQGPFHYIADDPRPLAAGPTAFIGTSLSPGYLVHPGDNCDAPLTSARFAPAQTATTRMWGGSIGARLSRAKGVDDFSADGLRDYVMGSPFSSDNRGAAFLVFGRLRELVRGGEFNIEELARPAGSPDPLGNRVFDGLRIVGNPGDRLGDAIDDAGDFNNDGIADVAIGSPFVNNRRGGAAVFFGSRDVANLTDEEILFDDLPTRGLGVIFQGEADGDLAGARVGTAGDVDGDGNDDILIAAPNRSVRLDLDQDGVFEIDRTNCGVVYLVYGSPKLTGSISLSLCGTPELPGAIFIGRNSADFLGAALGDQGDRTTGIATAGDVDGDGRADLLMSAAMAAPRNRAAAGEAYLLYGQGD